MIKIVEVGPRDGLQNEPQKLSLDKRVQLIDKLVSSGLKSIEIGSFVSPQAIPQMADTAKVVSKVNHKIKSKKLDFSVLVPNMRGYEDSRKVKCNHIAVFGACTESFSLKNINADIKRSHQRFKEVAAAAKKDKVKLRGYLSTVFGCPYEGKVKISQVVKAVNRMQELGVKEISLGDTIGVATPKQVKKVLKALSSEVSKKSLAMHFHDTRGTALANVAESLEAGIKTFDSSVGSLGGCPYAKGATGNLATEDLVYFLMGMGVKTGVDIDSLIKTAKWLELLLKRPLPSHLSKAALPDPLCF